MSGSNKALVLPLLTDENARLTAGARTLYFCWRGGDAPYQVRICRAGSDIPVLARENVQENRMKQEGLRFTEGTYRVEVRDPTHEPAIGTFQVVPAAERPTLSAELSEPFQQSALGDDVKDTLLALWLIEKY